MNQKLKMSFALCSAVNIIYYNIIFFFLQAFMKAKLSPKDVPPASPEPMANISEEEDNRSESASSVEDGFKCKYST